MNSGSLTQQIRTEPRPSCVLCGGAGDLIHRRQTDRLFGAPGTWDFRRCINPDCRLVWLDPMPLEEDIGKAYLSYYTHDAPEISSSTRVGLLRRSFRMLKQAYLTDRFGYETEVTKAVARAFGKVLYFFPRRRRRVDEEVRFLNWTPRGRLLDVGCGSGHWLLQIAKMGWQVEGVDFDEQSVSLARRYGLSVHLGSLEEQRLPNESFDVVTLSHVIEHVPDPVRTLADCARILKPGGQLVLYTPNTSSLGHRLFKQNWRGLEPPRHLHLFRPDSMRSLLVQAGFSHISIRARNSVHIWKLTFGLWKKSFGVQPGFPFGAVSTVGPYLMAFLEACYSVVEPEAGEWLFVAAQKT